MRNIFDQYENPENRITHALMTAINEDRVLLGHFLHELVKIKPPCKVDKLIVLEQCYPGEETIPESDSEKRGIPDGWIADEETRWCVFIESKVISLLSKDQIARHRRTSLGRGFEHTTAVAIAPIIPSSPPKDTILLEWRMVYAWLRRWAHSSSWARHAADFLEITEAQLIDNKQLTNGSLTMFSGFPFSRQHPYTYFEGKRVLGLAMSDLRLRQDLVRQLGMNPAMPGRSAITGSKSEYVWDFLSLTNNSKKNTFTNFPHLTLGVKAHAIDVMITVPHAVNRDMRRNLVALGEDGFKQVITKIVANLDEMVALHPGATPWFRGVQRRYPSQRSVPFLDAEINFDLRTAVPGSGPPKDQPNWLVAAYGTFVNKKSANYQIQVGVVFPYDRCPELAKPSALDLVAKAWLACKPLVDLGRK